MGLRRACRQKSKDGGYQCSENLQRLLSPSQSSPLQDAHRFLAATPHWTTRDYR
jgi:hypothetical protein